VKRTPRGALVRGISTLPCPIYTQQGAPARALMPSLYLSCTQLRRFAPCNPPDTVVSCTFDCTLLVPSSPSVALSHVKTWLNERARQHTAVFDITSDGRLYSSHINIPKMMLRCKAEYEINSRTHTGTRTLAYSSFKGD